MCLILEMPSATSTASSSEKSSLERVMVETCASVQPSDSCQAFM
ncbi:MAG: hypothetical protein OIN89_05050 [Candidatus Methanoperedens sp.]|nr:hypothetical protein [Candidatus Methanoperedens sp.]